MQCAAWLKIQGVFSHKVFGDTYREKQVKLHVSLGSSDKQKQARNRRGGYEQLQQITQIIQLAKIIEVVYKCIPVVQILLFSVMLLGGGVWEGGREVRGP